MSFCSLVPRVEGEVVERRGPLVPGVQAGEVSNTDGMQSANLKKWLTSVLTHTVRKGLLEIGGFPLSDEI